VPNANEDRFLGALLGLAIGDALGMPVEGWTRERIAERYGVLDGYHLRVFPDGTEVKAGEFTDETEIALCVVESLTANDGVLDPENVGARMGYLARGESKRWMGADTLAALARAEETLSFSVPIDEDGPATGEVAARGVPIGLLHAVGGFDPERFRADVEGVVRLTHGSPAAIAGATAVAYGVRLAARGETPRERWAAETSAFVGGGAVAEGLARAAELGASDVPVIEALATLRTGQAAAEAVPAAFAAAASTSVFEEAVFAAVRAGGDADTVGAIAGALVGAAHGAGGIPQGLIDELEGRIYVSLAAPWFHRTALRRAGLVIDLRPTGSGPGEAPPRPLFPPRQ
jgi:ADP-ribosylglycohydrolase